MSAAAAGHQAAAGRLDVTLVKLGGSLITDKTKPRTVATEHLPRLAAEIAAGWSGGALVIGHGSGSFGHPEARAAGLAGGRGGARRGPDADPMGIARTQSAAVELHRLVVESLVGAGVPAYSQLPSGFLVADDGEADGPPPAPLAAALREGLVPVTMGDVVVDRTRGASIASTETVFEFLARALVPLGVRVRRAVWLGATAGVLDDAGRLVRRIDAANIGAASEAAGGSPAVDVTGGMEHRLATAWALARRGVESLIIDGRRPGLLESVLRHPEGEAKSAGTLVGPGEVEDARQ
ncbi:MAG: isopentenyl phosphate kinase [Acidobacteriota bacterium]|nr:isopentenyl phosphate kinase [Acidobacteriota bacterium]MDE3263399.1 isopentenyl phosphate kinase [Acidobacteriota bacterium]